MITFYKRTESDKVIKSEKNPLANASTFSGQESQETGREDKHRDPSVFGAPDARFERNAADSELWPAISANGTAAFNDINFAFDRHFRMSRIRLFCGRLIDAMDLSFSDMHITPNSTDVVSTRVKHGGGGGSLLKPVIKLDSRDYIYKMVAHSTYHDIHHPPRLGHLEIHLATWTLSDKGSRALYRYWGPFTCGTPSSYPGKPLSTFARSVLRHQMISILSSTRVTQY